MRDLIKEALRGATLAYAIVDPKAFPDSIPGYKPGDGVEGAISTLREYAETCNACLAACKIPVEFAPEIARASGILDGFLDAYAQSKLHEADWPRPSSGSDAEGGPEA